MTKRIFVCHAKSDIEPTSETIDSLESALDFPSSVLLTSSLPGYSSDVRSDDELRAMLASTTVVLALLTEATMEDPEFSFELGAAWALGIDVIPLICGGMSSQSLPWPLRSCPSIRPADPADWDRLIEDLSLRLDAPRRSVAEAVPEPTPVSPAEPKVPDHERETVPERVPTHSGVFLDAAPVGDDEASFADVRNAVFDDAQAALSDDARDRAFDDAHAAVFDDAHAAVLEDAHAAVLEDAHSAQFDAAAAAMFDAEPVAQPPLAAVPESFDDETPTSDVHVARVMSVSSDPISEPPAANSDVYARLPSCEMSLEAGRAVSDCVFNRAEISDFDRELSEPLGRFVEAMGGSWADLRRLQDLELWLSATENLLSSLPPELHRVANWYQVGFELATLHNLAGQLVLDGPDRSDAAEQQWRTALDRFLTNAEKAHIGYEDLGRVLPLLENLAGPRAERDLTNIGRSLSEVRSYAVGADRIHTAA